MRRYGNAAIEAVKLILSTNINPKQAWDIATGKEFGKGTASQKKGCPKGTFLGLCEQGMIKGVPIGNYTDSLENKRYAVRTVKILKEKPEKLENEDKLWVEVTGGKPIKQNHQLDVVISLWNKNYINI
jgi:hypothetical protein